MVVEQALEKKRGLSNVTSIQCEMLTQLFTKVQSAVINCFKLLLLLLLLWL